jgi:hypothetical protein
VKYVPAWLPGAGFKRYAQETQKQHRIVRDRPIAFVEAGMVSLDVILVDTVLTLRFS